MNPRYAQIKERAHALLLKRGLFGHVAANRFCQDFMHYLVAKDAFGIGNAEVTLSLLENDANLTDGNILNTNFRTTFNKLISPALSSDPLFMELFPTLLNSKGKGVGIGELVLPLIISNYRFSNVSDGMLLGNLKVEVKSNGASLKPIKTGLTEKGIVDKLNSQYFKGNAPGCIEAKKFANHLATVNDPAVYADYFSQLYPGCDLTELLKEVTASYRSAKDFNAAVGKFALKQYQRTDGWHCIMYVDGDTFEVVNIADTDNTASLGMKYTPKFKRGKDTQAICDGYVNASF